MGFWHDCGLKFRAAFRVRKFLSSWLSSRPADPEVTQARMATCYGCLDLNFSTMQCEVCTCFVRTKTLWREETCPKNKW
jgi:hypothetical protein